MSSTEKTPKSTEVKTTAPKKKATPKKSSEAVAENIIPQAEVASATPVNETLESATETPVSSPEKIESSKTAVKVSAVADDQKPATKTPAKSAAKATAKKVEAEIEAKPATTVVAEAPVVVAKPEAKPAPKVEPEKAQSPVATQPGETTPKDSENAEASEDATEAQHEPGAGFRFLQLSEPVMRAIIDAGYEAPTPIQAQAIPVLLAGHDLIGQAQTGTGKTAAFALPLSEKLKAESKYTQAIVLLPTRELCIQVAQEMHNLSKYKRLRVVPVYGGQPIDRQLRALSMGAHVVVGTPGRVLDHLRRGTLDLTKVEMVVLDEADEMLNMGFLEDVEEILKSAPKERQTALFSATMPPRIAALSRDYLKNPQKVSIESKRRTVSQVKQTYYEVLPSQKLEALARILDHESPGSTIIFCRTRREVDELGEALQMRGYEAETLHGEMNQAARDRVMSRFRASQADLLIATDVAARGLDIDQVTHVVNYDIPWDTESYIHRIGRTGRAGRSGEAITLISPRERYQLRQIETMINARILPARVPSSSDIATRRRELFKNKILEVLGQANYEGLLQTVEELTEDGTYDSSQIAAAALQMLWKAQKGADYDVNEANVETERTEAGMTRLFLQIGRQDGIRPGDIVGAIANEAGVPGNLIGAIDIMDRSAYVEVPEASAARVIEALSQAKLRGKRVYVEVARPKREEPEFGGGDDRGGRPGGGGRPFPPGNRGGGDWGNRGGGGGGYGGRPRPGGGGPPRYGRPDTRR